MEVLCVGDLLLPSGVFRNPSRVDPLLLPTNARSPVEQRPTSDQILGVPFPSQSASGTSQAGTNVVKR